MTPFSRRNFIRTSGLLSVGILSAPSLLSSCLSKGSGRELSTAYLGRDEEYEDFAKYFRRSNNNSLEEASLEDILNGNQDMVLVNTSTDIKSAYILMLLEGGKDVLTTFPLGNNLGEYSSISDFSEKHGRFVGILNPVLFYPSVEELRDFVSPEGIYIQDIEIGCHPRDLIPGFIVEGVTGPAQILQRAVTHISSKYPVSLHAVSSEYGILDGISLEYGDFKCRILYDEERLGWDMKINTSEGRALCDHTGLLAVESEPEPRFSPDPDVMEKAILVNINDFSNAVRERTEPAVSMIDGLASIMLNKAVDSSLITGTEFSL